MSLPSLKQSQVEPEFRWRDSNQRIRLRAGAWCAFGPGLNEWAKRAKSYSLEV